MNGFLIKNFLYFCTGFVWFVSCTGEVAGQVFDKVVGRNGTDQYNTIQSALNSVPDNSAQRTLIFVRKGLYTEKVLLAVTKTNVSLIGESTEGVIISWDDYQGKNGLSGANSYTFLAEGNGFYCENITIRNTAGSVGQAVALRTTGDVIFKNCRFLGNQDTYYAHKKRVFNLDCFVEGTTDFVYGDATAVFRRCTLNCLKGGQYISAPADTKLTSTTPSGKFYHGLLFDSCRVTPGSGIANQSFFLGRPWQPEASSVFIRCTLYPHIKSQGWSVWGGNNHLTGCYAEYGNVNPDGTPVDVSQRVTWSKQLTEQEVASYYNLSYFLRKDGLEWNPLPLTVAPSVPDNMVFSSDQLSWQGVQGARGYVILRNDTCAGFSVTPDFKAGSMAYGKHLWSVKSVSGNGNLSAGSTPLLISSAEITGNHGIPLIRVENGVIYLSETADVVVFTLSGQIILAGRKVKEITLCRVFRGPYIVKATTKNGLSVIKKIVF